jgi:chromosome segregation and condensation protein ScpB|tara:strand:+ start:590 stop:832 length:243 start_codon:yes stop_codon:yes gene_type:complete
MKTITDKYIKSLFNSISSELIELVKQAEKMPYTTKNNYGEYIKLLTMLKPQVGLNNAAQLLVLAKGNKQGILDAKKIINN